MSQVREGLAAESRDPRAAAAAEAGQVEAATWILFGILLLATGLRLYGLWSWPFEQDELYTLRDAQAFGDRVNFLRPVYYFLQHLLLAVSPPTPLNLRLLPFFFGVLGIWLTWQLARRTFGTTAGLVSAFLVAISPWHLHASQFARYWTLVYLLAALLYMVLPRAVDTDRPGAYLLALLTIIVGTLTHPTFAFPMVGVALAVIVISKEGRLRWGWPSRRAWLYLWGPLAVVAVGGFAFHELAGSFGALGGSRGLTARLRLLPAMVQWTSPAVVTAAVAGITFLLLGRGSNDRRWSVIATLGTITGVGLLLAFSFRTKAYADYGMAMLPLVYVTVGGVVQRVSQRMSFGAREFVVGSTLTLAAAVLPGTISHLSDGTRFDYRPAYAYIQRVGGDNVVVGWPRTIQRYYARDLQFELLRRNPAQLAQILQRTSGFWLVASYRRYGMVRDDGVARWVDAHCQTVLETERPRLDYRTYRVELQWCGDSPAPT